MLLSMLMVVIPALGQVVVQERTRMFIAEAEKRIFPCKDVTSGWSMHQISRGGTTIVSMSTSEYNMDGDEVWFNNTYNYSSLSGTLVAVPIGDFKVESSFLYCKPGSMSTLTGLVVSVEVQLSAGAKHPTEQAMQKAVKDMVCTGMALSSANGGKPMRIAALKKTVCRRFGGKNPRPHYNAKDGKVYLLVEDCQLSKGDPTFVPATPEGASRKEREKLVKLHRDNDRGGVTYIGLRTEIHPEGSQHIHDRIQPSENVSVITF